MIRQYLVSSVLALVCFTTGACAENTTKTAESPPSHIVVLGRTVTQQQIVECPQRPTNAKALAKYIRQYDVSVEKDFLSTAYKYSPLKKFLDEDSERPTGILAKNWTKQALDEVMGAGFGTAYKLGVEVDPIRWTDFTGDGVCDFSAFQSLVGMRASVGRTFLFRGLKNDGYQLVMSQADDDSGAYGQKFFAVDVSEEKFPLIFFTQFGTADVADPNLFFQWNPSIQGFNTCPRKTYSSLPAAFKIYVKTAIAQKDSLLGKLCASPQDRAVIGKFIIDSGRM